MQTHKSSIVDHMEFVFTSLIPVVILFKMMTQKRRGGIFTNKFNKYSPLISLISVKAFATSPLVAFDEVREWKNGLTQELNCHVSVPFTFTFSSESGAKLSYLLPIGSEVEKGQLVAQQQDFYLKQQLTRLENEHTLSASILEHHNAEYTRLQTLKDTLISTTQLEKAKLNKKTTEVELKQLQSQIDELKHRISRLSYFAPTDGVILNTFSEPGEYLNQGDKVLSFASQHDKELTCQLPIATYSQFELASYQLNSVKGSSLNVARVDPNIPNTSQLVQVYLTPIKTPLPYFLGERVKVTMRIESTLLTKLPADSINFENSGNFVWQVNETGNVSKVNIRLHKNLSNYFLVESSLKAGDKIVTQGKSGLIPNQVVALKGSEELL